MTNELEKLILSGQAEYRVQSGYSSQAISIPCPAGKQIVIIDLDFTAGISFLGNLIGTGLLFLKLYGINQGRENIITFYVPGADTGNARMGNQWKRDVFFCYNSPVRIDFACLINDAFPAVDVSVMPPVSKDKPEPNGYGTTLPVTRAIDFSGAGDFYIPQNVDLSGFPITAGMKNDPFPALIAGSTTVPSPSTANSGFALNVGYVLLNKPIIPKL